MSVFQMGMLAGLTFGIWADHTRKIDVQVPWIPAWKASLLLTLSRTRGGAWGTIRCLLLVLLLVWTAPLKNPQVEPCVYLTGDISLPWNIHHGGREIGMYQIAARSTNCYHRDTGEVQPEARNLSPSGGRLLRRDIRASLLGRNPWEGHSGLEKE